MNALKTKFNTEEAGKRAGVNRGTVAIWIKRGWLKATNVGDGMQRPRWQIEQEDLEETIRHVHEIKESSRVTKSKKKEPLTQESYIRELLEENRLLQKRVDELELRNKQIIENILEVLIKNED